MMFERLTALLSGAPNLAHRTHERLPSDGIEPATFPPTHYTHAIPLFNYIFVIYHFVPFLKQTALPFNLTVHRN